MILHKKINSLSFTVILSLLIAILLPGLQNVANAQVTISVPPNAFDTNDITVYPSQAGNLPSIYHDGTYISPSSHSYTWSSSDSSVLSVDNTTTYPSYTAGSLPGDAVLTATYQGESARVLFKVRMHAVMNPPTTSGLAAIPPLFPGITTGMAITNLHNIDDNSPISGATVTFYDSEKKAGGNVICTATTNANGDASCSLLLLMSYSFYCAYFEGNSQSSAFFTCNVS